MKWKSLAVYVLCCFLLCNSVLANFESVVTGSDGGDESASCGVSVSSDSGSDSFVSDIVEDLPNDSESLGEKVDSVVDSNPALVDPSFSVDSSGDLLSEVSPGGNTVYVLTQPDLEADHDSIVTPVSIDDPSVTITDISFASVSPVTPSSTSGLKAALLGILGNYDPVVIEFQYSGGNGYTNYLREIQPDYVWLCSAALLALVIYCLFKLGGGLIRG